MFTKTEVVNVWEVKTGTVCTVTVTRVDSVVPEPLVAEILNVKVPVAVVVPVIAPVAVFSDRPSGSAPVVTAKVGVGPLVVKVTEYASPRVRVFDAVARLVKLGLSQMVTW